ncbi:MAG: cobalamin biosynthesis protein CobW, partial [Clostridia bacterium]|nr:cobalamin biosynthesis protein CobW [Clostridia bacterium]
HEHHHHDHEDGEECCCGHHHDHEHHHHDHECSCGCHGHHHHDADEVFASYGEETPLSYTRAELTNILSALKENILRSKGVVKGADTNNWYYFDFVAGDYEIREGEPDVIGKFCVIGTDLNKQELKNLFLKKV